MLIFIFEHCQINIKTQAKSKYKAKSFCLMMNILNKNYVYREVSSSVNRVDRWSDDFEEDMEILDENLLLSSPSSRAYLSRVEEILNLDQDPS